LSALACSRLRRAVRHANREPRKQFRKTWAETVQVGRRGATRVWWRASRSWTCFRSGAGTVAICLGKVYASGARARMATRPSSSSLSPGRRAASAAHVHGSYVPAAAGAASGSTGSGVAATSVASVCGSSIGRSAKTGRADSSYGLSESPSELTPRTHMGRASAVCRRSRRECTGAPTTGSRTSCNERRLAPCRRPG
jgi:hypothetical protein